MAIVGNQILLPLAVRATSGFGDVVVLDGFSTFTFQLDVMETDATPYDFLDVYISTTVDGGLHWVDTYRFARVAGNDYVAQFLGEIQYGLEGFEAAASLDEAEGRALIGSRYRVRWEITDDSGDASFEFSVKLNAT